jgi:hypothetical protein
MWNLLTHRPHTTARKRNKPPAEHRNFGVRSQSHPLRSSQIHTQFQRTPYEAQRRPEERGLLDTQAKVDLPTVSQTFENHSSVSFKPAFATNRAPRQRATPLDTTSSGVGSFSDSPDSGPPSVPPSREAESVQI